MKTIISVLCLLCWAAVANAQFSLKFFVNPTTLQFKTVTIGDSLDKTISFVVDSSAPKDVTVNLTNPLLPNNYSYVGGTKSFVVQKGKTYTLTVRFKPTALGAFRDTITLTHDGDTTFVKSPSKLLFGGQGIAKDTSPKITLLGLQQGGLNFGTDSAGSVTTRSFYVTNTSDTARVLSGNVGSPKTTPYSFIGAAGSFTLNKGDSMKVTVAFSAPTKAGTYRDTIIVTSNSNPSTSSIKIPCTAIVPGPDTIAKISVIPNSRFISFGNVTVGKSKQSTITIKNTTNVALTLNGTVATTNHSLSYSLAQGAGPYTLAQGDSMHVVVTFTPDTVKMNLTDSLVITSNSDPANQKFVMVLFGSGIAPDTLPRFSLSGTQNSPNGQRLNFGTSPIGVPVTRSITISNTTDGKISTLSGTVGALKTTQFVLTTAGTYSIDSGKTATVSITFTPTAIPQLTDTLVITSNDTVNKLVRVILTGSGRLDTMAKITVNNTNLDFGTVAIGSPVVARSFSISNSSDTAKALTFSETYPLAPFHLASGGGSFSLNQGEAHADSVTLTPIVAGTYNDSIIVNSNTDFSTSHLVIHIHAVVTANGVRESKAVASCSVYPNPATSEMHLQVSLTEDAQVSAAVYDILGNQVQSLNPMYCTSGVHEIPIVVAELPNGNYYLRLQLADGTKTIRFVVAR